MIFTNSYADREGKEKKEHFINLFPTRLSHLMHQVFVIETVELSLLLPGSHTTTQAQLRYHLSITARCHLNSLNLNTGHLASIGKLPALASWYIGIFRSVFLYRKLWREHLLKISQELFFWKIPREFLFFSKGGRSVQKGGQCPPLHREKGAPAIFLYRNVPTEFSFGIG